MKFLNLLLLAIPISIFLQLSDYSPVLLFIAAGLSIIPLAGYMGKATEEIAIYVGPRVGGLLNATFGNAAELIITIFALKAGLVEVVKASITGSIIGNLLLVLGLSMLLGGFKYKSQKFNRAAAGMHTSMLFMAVTGLIIPAVFLNTHSNPAAEPLSLGVASVLMLVYILSLIFSLHTHKDVFRPSQEHSETPEWSKLRAMLVLLIATLFVVIESEFLVEGIEPVVKTLGISELFIGVIVIPIIGNAAEHSTSVIMAMKNKMEISLKSPSAQAPKLRSLLPPCWYFWVLYGATP